MITVISKHMARSAPFLGRKAGSRLLALIHLVEACRYHLSRFETLASGQGSAPPAFEPGIDIKDKQQLDHLYSFMASWFEVEAFLLSAKRFLDQCWCLRAESFQNGAERVKTMGAAMNSQRMHQVIKSQELEAQIYEDRFYRELRRVWDAWGRELVDLRNYIEHEIPWGGMTFNEFKISVRGGGPQEFDTFLPDQIPSRHSRIPKEKFTFKEHKSLTQYMRDRMTDVDALVDRLFPIDPQNPLVTYTGPFA